MSVAVFFLIAGCLSAAVAMVLFAALSNDPTPSMSGYLPLLIFFGCASPICLVLAAVSWIIDVTIGVLA
ncbi:hypothetical protein ASD64_07175 [Mesorhizobium sp. Root157]|nr:hypothetical protein ASD64_07175 [Mesorhizobium sp. Root157]